MTKKELLHLAKLAQLRFDDEQLEKFEKQFNEILSFVERLKEIDTKNIKPLYHPIENIYLDANQWIVDDKNKDDIIKNSPHKVDNKAIVIKSGVVEH